MSTIKADTLVASDGTSPTTLTKQHAAKHWVHFNGTGTIAVYTNGSFNTASIADNGTGDYDVNLSSAMSGTDSCYYVAGGSANQTKTFPVSATRYSIDTQDSGGTQEDRADVGGTAHGDLA